MNFQKHTINQVRKEVEDKIGSCALKMLDRALSTMTEDMYKVEGYVVDSEHYTEEVINNLIDNQAELMLQVFKWQKNLNPYHLRDYADQLISLADLIDLLNN